MINNYSWSSAQNRTAHNNNYTSANNSSSNSRSRSATSRGDRDFEDSTEPYAGVILFKEKKEIIPSKILCTKAVGTMATLGKAEDLEMYETMSKAIAAGQGLNFQRHLDVDLRELITKAFKANKNKAGQPFLPLAAKTNDWINICRVPRNVKPFRDYMWKACFKTHMTTKAIFRRTEFEMIQEINKNIRPFLDPKRARVTEVTLLNPASVIIRDFDLDKTGTSEQSIEKAKIAIIRTFDVSRDIKQEHKGISRKICQPQMDRVLAEL